MSQSAKTRHENRDLSTRFFDAIEKVGNKLPDPFLMFVSLAILVIIASAIGQALNASVVHPQTNEDTPVKSLATEEGLIYILDSMLDNFTGFAPLGLVLGIMLGIGLTEQVGYLDTAIRKSVARVPSGFLPYLAVFIGVLGNLASDAALVLIPPLMAIAFLKVGRHPIAGIAAGFAGAGAGFTANIFVSGTDALLAGISTEAAKIIDDTTVVSPVANWYFNIVCTILLALVGGWITNNVVEKRLGRYSEDEGSEESSEDDEEVRRELTPREHKAFWRSTLFGLLYVVFIGIVVAFPSSPLRGENGSIVNSPFLSSIIPLLLGFFLVLGVSYGIMVGKIKSSADVSKHMAEAMSSMGSYIVMVFAIAQFIEYFNWSNLGLWIAVTGAEWLTTVGFTGVALIFAYSAFTVLLNFLITSGSAQWALQAPIFVPMLMQLGYTPGFIQAAYRIGDSSTNIVTPLFPYMPVVLAYIRKYDKNAGIGTYMSIMMPYSIAFFVVFNLVLYAFYFLGLPYGPGVYPHL
ncbi:AbgT family transporter [Corynebacterium propinquum]